MLQFAIHMASLLAAIHLASPHTRPGWVCGPDSINGTAARDAGEPAPPCPGPCTVPEGAGAGAGCGGCVGGPCISDRDPDAGFSPSVLNSAVFLATGCVLASVFVFVRARACVRASACVLVRVVSITACLLKPCLPTPDHLHPHSPGHPNPLPTTPSRAGRREVGGKSSGLTP